MEKPIHNMVTKIYIIVQLQSDVRQSIKYEKAPDLPHKILTVVKIQITIFRIQMHKNLKTNMNTNNKPE